jgi:broad specificity phosphatase PhoE
MHALWRRHWTQPRLNARLHSGHKKRDHAVELVDEFVELSNNITDGGAQCVIVFGHGGCLGTVNVVLRDFACWWLLNETIGNVTAE